MSRARVNAPHPIPANRTQWSVWVPLILFLPISSVGQHFSYPREVDLSPLQILASEEMDSWKWREGATEYEVSLEKPAFFRDQTPLTVTCLKSKQFDGSEIVILKAGETKVRFRCDIGMIGFPYPASFADFDNNGLQDLKLIFPLGGNAGHANIAQAYYLLQTDRYWNFISFYLRDGSYSWECDLDGDGKYELLKGHHQDLTKPGYHDPVKDKWVPEIFRKYLFINAYSIEENGLKICNHLHDSLPIVLCFKEEDPSDAANDARFIEENQFPFPDDYVFMVRRMQSP